MKVSRALLNGVPKNRACAIVCEAIALFAVAAASVLASMSEFERW